MLPFENLSAEPENAFFTDGVQDEILNDLAKIADLEGDQPDIGDAIQERRETKSAADRE